MVHWESDNSIFRCTDGAGWLTSPGSSGSFQPAVFLAAWISLAVLSALMLIVYAPIRCAGFRRRAFVSLMRLDSLLSKDSARHRTKALPSIEGAIKGSVVVACFLGLANAAIYSTFDSLDPRNSMLRPYMLSSVAHNGYEQMRELHSRLRFETLISDCAQTFNATGNDGIQLGPRPFCTPNNTTFFPFSPSSNATLDVECLRIELNGQHYCQLSWTGEAVVNQAYWTRRSLAHSRPMVAFAFNNSLGGVNFVRVSSYLVAESLINEHQRAISDVEAFARSGGGQYIFSSFEQCKENDLEGPMTLELEGLVRRVHFEPFSNLDTESRLDDFVAQGVSFPELKYPYAGSDHYFSSETKHYMSVELSAEELTWQYVPVASSMDLGLKLDSSLANRVIGNLVEEIERLKTENAALSEPTCCPAGSTPYLASDYAVKGKKTSTGSVEFYETGASGSAAILLFPDVWGWDSGRTRAMADYFADQGFFVVVPKVLQPALEGGTDGDGLPPDFSIGERGADFGPWAKAIPWEASVKPKTVELLAYIREKGCTKIGLIGCCWGGWAASHTSILDKDVTCGVIFHPSNHIEQAVHGGDDLEAFMGKVQCPFFLMPAGNDKDEYKPGGAVAKLLASKFPKSRSQEFADMSHGWVPRGDISDAKVERDVAHALSLASDFFKAAMLG